MFFRRFASTSTLPPTIRQLLSSPGTAKDIQVNGWVKSIRRQKKVSFAVITDGSSAQGLQAVLSDASLSKQLTNGTSVRLSGRLTESRGPGQDHELQVDSLEVLGECHPETYPIQKQALSTEYLRDNCHLRTRTEAGAAMLRLRHSTSQALHHYFEGQGFCYAHTPIITSNDCEGAGETFRIAPVKGTAPGLTSTEEFFSRPAYLTVSSQLHLEALASAVSRVYTLSPCFRAERSQTSRHLAEFWMLEAEWAFTNRVTDVCDVVEAALKTVLRASNPDLAALWNEGDMTRRKAIEDLSISDARWTQMSYTDAISELETHQAISGEFQYPPAWGNALQSEHERWLAEKLVGGPVFVTDYPAALKPFYMRLNDDGRTVACFDLLVPHVGELAGGSLREERLPMLESSLAAHNLDRDAYQWYLDLRKYGGAPHGGFGMGFERLIGWLSGIENVRECIPMPRWAGRMLL
ncbi:hypothetical protein PLICRDRAFT_46113 [Plicaturopsis crispa FD-325 SS-3]|uniref:Asparagine--tRNA ligase, mitochondrial n=1 Tax=Plicaturopsis crispa FD-325 SS-3 TaxID=944288 RepID=A0A0C9SXC3_PLICR|nr:hypothetical protein PLICRDRAFT_46113 [Plicaturopsis crispa FD-325 SS-3]